MKRNSVAVLAVLLVASTCGADGKWEKSGKSDEDEEMEREKIDHEKKLHPVYILPPGQTFNALKDIGIKLKPHDKDLVKEYLSNASVLLFKLKENQMSEVNGSSVVDALTALGKSLIANLPDVAANDTLGKRYEFYEGLDISMEIVKQRRENFSGYEFPPTNVTRNTTDASGRGSRIRLPKQIFKNVTANVVEILSLLFEAIPEMESNANRTKKRVNGKMIGVSINPPLPFELGEKDDRIELTFVKENSNGNDTCVYWDAKARQFSSHGMTLKFSNGSIAICESSHLTEFTVLSEESNLVATTAPPTTKPISGAGIFSANRIHIFSCLMSAIVFLTLLL